MTISKATLTKVYTSDKDKNGVPFIAKASGRPYSKMSIKCVEHGDKWLSGFKGKENEFWKEGDVVDIIVKQNGEYLNYEVPKAEDKLAMRVSALEVDVMQLKNALARGTTATATPVAPQPSTNVQAARSVSGPDDFGQIVVDDEPF